MSSGTVRYQLSVLNPTADRFGGAAAAPQTTKDKELT